VGAPAIQPVKAAVQPPQDTIRILKMKFKFNPPVQSPEFQLVILSAAKDLCTWLCQYSAELRHAES